MLGTAWNRFRRFSMWLFRADPHLGLSDPRRLEGVSASVPHNHPLGRMTANPRLCVAVNRDSTWWKTCSASDPLCRSAVLPFIIKYSRGPQEQVRTACWRSAGMPPSDSELPQMMIHMLVCHRCPFHRSHFPKETVCFLYFSGPPVAKRPVTSRSRCRSASKSR